MHNKEAVFEKIAKDSLTCIEAVVANAKEGLGDPHRGNPTVFATINTLNNPNVAENLRNVTREEIAALEALLEQPILARIDFIDENNKEDTLFITRSTPRPIPGYKIASYRSPMGRLASLPAGEEGTFRMGGKELELLVDSSAQLKPTKPLTENGFWDSKDTTIDIRGQGKFTIGSLRELIYPATPTDDIDSAELWQDDSDDNVVEGLRRSIITKMGLRDQPILDQQQDEIFRLPINSSCFLSGPPGTGKTTTLIRRLGQKTDWKALQESGEPIPLIEKVELETQRVHKDSWVLFSPTELLRMYVKEAFNKEGLAASDEHIRTWDEFRKQIARENLGLLRTTSGKGPFVERRAQSYLKPEVTNDAEWYDDFRRFNDDLILDEIKSDASDLANSKVQDLSEIGKSLDRVFSTAGRDFYSHTINGVADFLPSIREAIARRGEKIGRILAKHRNALTFADRNFPDLLVQEISVQITGDIQDADDEEDLERALEDDEEQAIEPQAGRLVSKAVALTRLEGAIKAFARARLARRRLSEKSKNGMLIAWLGASRLPSDDETIELGTLLTEQSKLRKFERLERLFLRGIPIRYKRFRAEMLPLDRWYQAAPIKPSDIYWQELDLVILATLQVANEILSSFRQSADRPLPEGGPLSAVRFLQRAQVVVDEATDFSLVQLACMKAIAHPTLNSLFLCGDINQRLTTWGLKSRDSLVWVAPRMQHKFITVSYRQTQKLVDLATQIAAMGGSQPDDIVLPEQLDAVGLAPVWQENLGDNPAIAKWLKERILEIEVMVGRATTIAVLVNDEEQVEPLASALNDLLEEINLAAVACKDGKVVGNDLDVRVFCISHIKGLEFEAVFFVDLDYTVSRHPQLFSKYLYVGATRAATYLGITFNGDIPEQLTPMEHHFGKHW